MTPTKFHAASKSAGAKKPLKSLGPLPEWNLADLYPAMDAPEVKRDLDRGETECIEFETAYKGRLADIAASPDAGRTLGEAVRRYEAIEDVLGRHHFLCRAALRRQHHRSGDRQVLRRHAGAHHRGLVHLLFFTLELNRLDDAALDEGDGRSRARPLPAMDRGPPQGQAVPARGPRRAAVAREVGDRSLRLQPPVRRDHGGPALYGRRQDAGARADAEPAGRTPTPRSARRRPRRWPRPSRRTCGCSRWSPTRSPRTRRSPTAGAASATSRSRATSPTGSSPRWSTRWCRRCARPIRGCRTATTRSRRAGSARSNCRTGTATRRCRRSDAHDPWPEARETVLGAYGGVFAADGRNRRALLQRPLDRRAGAAGQVAGRLRASDGAVGASLSAAELPGQDARRDDARARARPRRPPGARRARAR